MISKLSNSITINLLKQNIIMYDEKELYDYGLFMIISYIVFFTISLLFGLFLDIPFASLIFYISFCLIRNFAGGAHAKTEKACGILTGLSIFAGVLSIKVLLNYKLIWVALTLLLFSAVSLFVIKPVVSPQKEITKREKMFFHKKLIVVTALFVGIAIVGMCLGMYNVMISISIGLAIASVLLFAGKLQQKYGILKCSNTES